MDPTLLAIVGAALLGILGFLFRTVLTMRSALTGLETQVNANGGQTMRDAVNRIEIKIDVVGTQLTDHLIASARTWAVFEAHMTHAASEHNRPAPHP